MAKVLEPDVHEVFEPTTSTWQYVIADPTTKKAVIIDPVLNYDAATCGLSSVAADALLDLVKGKGLTVDSILETHVHADHITAAKYLQRKLEASQGSRPRIGIGRRVDQVQDRFAAKYDIPRSEYQGAFDILFDDDETFKVGELEAKAIHLPGHTPDHLGYVIGSNVFCGDSLFNPDVGSARCDFPGGDASALFASVRRLLSLPEGFRLYTGHDYPPGGEGGRAAPRAATTVAEQNRDNKHLRSGVDEAHFVKWRSERDAGLAAPRLIHPALQFNIRAGALPAASADGELLVHLPLKTEALAW